MSKKVTNEKRCPKCGNTNVAFQGMGHGCGTISEGGKLPEINKHQFKCQNCNYIFWYTGDNLQKST